MKEEEERVYMERGRGIGIIEFSLWMKLGKYWYIILNHSFFWYEDRSKDRSIKEEWRERREEMTELIDP
jgi:hypothetical protein